MPATPNRARTPNLGSTTPVVPARILVAVAACLASLTCAVPSRGQAQDLGTFVDAVERRLERMRDLSADFVQKLEDPLNQTRQASGHLYLKTPRRMRWEYASGDLFVSDGDTLYQYFPSDNQVMVDPLGDSFDDRIPIGFLLGRPDLEQEFRRITSDSAEPSEVPGARVMRMIPRREGDLEEVLIEVDRRTLDLVRLRLSYVDGTASDFVLSGIRTDTGLDDRWFEFQIPDGVELIGP